MASTTAAQRSGSPADQQPPHSAGAAPRPFALSSNLAASGAGRGSSVAAESGSGSVPKYRASIGVPGAGGAGQPGQAHAGGSASANWRAVSPGRASTGAVGLGAGAGGGLRPASELLGVGQAGQALNSFQSSDTEAIDRWFEDLQQYEATLEEMAAASLDANFKEELSAIEQWFRVLSEAERTAALYSLLQNATPLQTRFFITVLQQMARQDPVQAALLSPANPSQLTFESQIESKLASLGLSKPPASPAMRQFARQSLAASNGGPVPTSHAPDSLLSPDSSAASTLANQRAKLKASARTSAPANLLLSAGNTLGDSLKSPLWSKDEVVRERSPSPRPHSTGSDSAAQPHPSSSSASLSSSTIPATAQFLRSPTLDASFDQLSPAIGGSWASMVNTPLVPMFGKGETMEPGNFGTPSLGTSWNGASPNPNGGIVLDDVKKYRRSARMSGLSGGALAGMYEEPSGANGGASAASLGSSTAADRANSAAMAQKRIQDQLQAVQHLKNMQQSAVNLGLGALSTPASPNVAAGQSSTTGPSSGVGGSRLTSTGALSSPGLQQTAMAAQQNWRNANAAHLPPPSPNNNAQYGGANSGHPHPQHDAYGSSPALNGLGVGTGGGLSPNLGLGVGNGALPSPNTAASVQAQAQAQLASLIALQQQMMQQQAQLQNLANLQGLNGLGMGLGNPGLGVGGIGGFGSQLSPRLGGGGGVGGPGSSPSGFGGFGFGGGPGGMIHSPRRSPRPHGNDRSPNFGSSFGSHASRPGGGGANSASGGGNPQQTPGSGANPDEPLDMNLLGDTPAWLRSLRLHKYTPNFEGVGWKEMVLLDDKDLEDKGVSALGARRKLLKVFETVRSKTGMALPGDGAEASSPVDSVKEDAPVSPVDSYHGNNDANDGKEEKETSA